MPERIEIQFAGPLASVSVIEPDRSDARQDQAAQLRMQKQLDTELDEFRIAREALAKAQGQFLAIQEQFLAEAEGQLLGLSLEIARKILMQEIKSERHDVDPIVRETLSRLPDCRDAVVHLHPDDLARCEMARGDNDNPDGESIRFAADPQIGRGECLVKTARGTVEASIDARMGEISRALTGGE
jgi:flagellar assembly protein FliH